MKVEPIESIGTQRCAYFWDKLGPEGAEESEHEGGLTVGDFPVYPPPCPEAVELRYVREQRGVYLGDAARQLGISTSEYSGLERGRVRPAAPSTWADALAGVREAPARWHEHAAAQVARIHGEES